MICPRFPPNLPTRMYLGFPPKAVPKAASSKFLTKQPISVPTSHLVFSFSFYIFGIVCSEWLLYLPYSYYFHSKIIILNPLWLTPRFPPNIPTRLYLGFPPKQYLRQHPLNFLLNSQAQFLLLILLLFCHFIFLLLFVLSYCYICHIHVIFIPKLPF